MKSMGNRENKFTGSQQRRQAAHPEAAIQVAGTSRPVGCAIQSAIMSDNDDDNFMDGDEDEYDLVRV